MTSFQIGLVVLACVFGGALAGMLLGRVLPAHHLGDDTKSLVTLASGTLSVLSALVIGLLISYAKGDFDAQTKVVQKFAADLILLDRVMRQLGPETAEARDLLRRYTTLKIALTWPEENAGREGPRLDDPAEIEMLESTQAKLRGLTPHSEAQRWLQSRALQIGGDLVEARWLLAAENASSVPRAFLATLILWLTILFTGFGLFAPPHATVVVALLLCAVSLAAAIFLTPGDGPPVGWVHHGPSHADAQRSGAFRSLILGARPAQARFTVPEHGSMAKIRELPSAISLGRLLPEQGVGAPPPAAARVG